MYAVEENGDPNKDFDPLREAHVKEQHFLIKWLGWSHIHNTWESEQTLRDQRVCLSRKLIVDEDTFVTVCSRTDFR